MERKRRKSEILYQYYSIFDIVIALLSYLLISVCVADFFNFMLIVEPIYLSIFTYRVRVSNENIRNKLEEYKDSLKDGVLEKDSRLQQEGFENY